MKPGRSHHGYHRPPKRVQRCVGSQGQLELINTGVYDLRELAELFRVVDTNTLAGAWVACVVDSLVEQFGPSAAAVARPLNIVAERLHQPQTFKGYRCRQKKAAPSRSAS